MKKTITLILRDSIEPVWQKGDKYVLCHSELRKYFKLPRHLDELGSKIHVTLTTKPHKTAVPLRPAYDMRGMMLGIPLHIETQWKNNRWHIENTYYNFDLIFKTFVNKAIKVGEIDEDDPVVHGYIEYDV